MGASPGPDDNHLAMIIIPGQSGTHQHLHGQATRPIRGIGSDISDNNNFDGPETVNLNGVYAFQISGPCTWYRTGP